jgi:acetolactate synthase-1/2/3 large subunit
VPGEASISCDAGAFGGWLMRYYRWRQPRTFFGPTAGGMGYALPAAIGAKLARPHAPALAFAGDGGFTMTMSELETAVRLRLAGLVVLVFSNSTYGTIRRHQQKSYPGRVVATDLGAIDFALLAQAMGAAGFRVARNADFAAALREALDAGRPAVVDITLDPDQLDPWSDHGADA